MRIPPPFAIYCAVILSLFTYTKYFGLALFGTTISAANARSSTSGGGSGGYYSGNSSGSHK